MSQQQSVPLSYVGCTAEPGQCPLRDHCLRSKVYREALGSAMNAPTLTVVNLRNAANRALTAQCAQYRPDSLQRFARGMTHLFDPIPKAKYKAVQQAVQQCFSSRITYFRSRGGQLLISPMQQAAIARVFQRYAIADVPCFDSYLECYDWE